VAGFSDEELLVVDGLLEAVTEVLALGSVVSFAGCANVGLLQRSKRVVHVRNCAPIVGIARVHSLTQRRALRMRLSGVVYSDHEKVAGKYCSHAQQLFARCFNLPFCSTSLTKLWPVRCQESVLTTSPQKAD